MDANRVLNYVFVGLGDETINIPSVSDVKLSDLKHRIEQRASFKVEIMNELIIILFVFLGYRNITILILS